jgi:hypothetical protein
MMEVSRLFYAQAQQSGVQMSMAEKIRMKTGILKQL